MESDDCSWVAIGKVKPGTAILIGLTSNNQYKSLVDVCMGRFLKIFETQVMKLSLSQIDSFL